MRRRSPAGRVAHSSSGLIDALIDGLRQRDKLPQALNAELDLGLTGRARLGRRLRDQQGISAPMLHLKGGREVATPARQPPQHDEAAPIKRMMRIVDRDLRRTGVVSLTRRDIPVGLRSKGWTGAG